MMKLSDKKWIPFYISDEKENGIFTLRSSLSGIDKNKLIESDDKEVPYITRSDFNNGVSLFIGRNQKEKYKIDDGNVITIGLDTQTVFYQPHSFYTGQNVQVLFNKHINRYTAQFIIPLLKKQVSKLSWGGNGATLGRLKRMQILLPVNNSNLPDYDFMMEYIQEREDKKRKEYINYCKKELEVFNNINKTTSIQEKKWKDFSIGGDDGIFKIYAGKRLTKSNMIKGTIPFIGATDSNNGVTNWIENINETYDSDLLGVNYNGSVVENFYHPYKCIFSDDVKRLHLKGYTDNKYVLLFLSTLIKMQKIKYTYGYKFNGSRMNRQKILLPIDAKGEPDYEYMETYAKNIIAKKMQNYIDYMSKTEH